MSINKKLQSMLSSDESGSFISKDKQDELVDINEAFMSKLGSLGGDIMSIAKGVTSRLMKVTSAAGKGIMTGIEKLDIENFKKKFDIKEITDLDVKLSQMKVNDPELFAIMKTLMLAMAKAKKVNKTLYDKAEPIFATHMDRLIRYYTRLLENTKDVQQAQMYLGILTDMLKWVMPGSHQRDKILLLITNIKDQKKVLKKVGKEPPEVMEVEKIFGRGKTYTSMTKGELSKLDPTQLDAAIKLLSNYVAAFEEVDLGTKIEQGRKMIDMDAMDEYERVESNLEYAKKLLGKSKPATQKVPNKKPDETAQPTATNP